MLPSNVRVVVDAVHHSQTIANPAVGGKAKTNEMTAKVSCMLNMLVAPSVYNVCTLRFP